MAIQTRTDRSAISTGVFGLQGEIKLALKKSVPISQRRGIHTMILNVLAKSIACCHRLRRRMLAPREPAQYKQKSSTLPFSSSRYKAMIGF